MHYLGNSCYIHIQKQGTQGLQEGFFFVCGVFIFQPTFIRHQLFAIDRIILGVCHDFYLSDPWHRISV